MEEVTIISLEKLNDAIDKVLSELVPTLYQTNEKANVRDYYPHKLFIDDFKLDNKIKLQKGDKFELQTLSIVHPYLTNAMEPTLDDNCKIIDFEVGETFTKLIADIDNQNNSKIQKKVNYVILKFPKELDYLKKSDRLKSIFTR